jgi:glutathione S-transferase
MNPSMTVEGRSPLRSAPAAALPDLRSRCRDPWGVMEKHLADRQWFVGGRYGIADIALYAYTHCAGDGGFDLAVFPHLRAWLARVRAQPGHTPMLR